MKKYRKYILFIILVGIITDVIGCAKSEKEEVVFRITWEAETGRGETIQSIVDMYNAQSEKYHVQMVGGDEDRNNILDALENNSVDVFMMPYRYIKDSEVASELATFDYTDEFDLFYPSMVEL